MPKPAKPPVKDSVAEDLYDQPGHLVRRAHQIAQAMFDDVVGSKVTPIQYAILRMVHERPGIDQVTLANLIALDTSTTALTAARLESKGWIVRELSLQDRRQRCLSLTKEGESLIRGLVGNVHQMRQKFLGALDAKDQDLFMDLLKRLVQLHNEKSRAPLRLEPTGSVVEDEPRPRVPAKRARRTS